MDFETIKFISLLNELAEKTKMGISHFPKQHQKISTAFYMMKPKHTVTAIQSF